MSRVTVLMTVYNGMPYIRRSVQSILDQSMTDWKCIIVDDGSTDRTSEFLDSITDARFIILHQPNSGIAVALNNGLAHCTTDYLARLDADDVAEPTRFTAQVAFLDAHPKIGLVGTQVVPLGTRGRGRSLNLPLEHGAIRSALIRGRHAVVHSSVMLRTSLLKSIGGYWHLPMGEEYDMMLRFGEISRLANLDSVQLQYRVHQGSLTDRSMRLAQSRIALACELARRREAGLPSISPEEFQAQRNARPMWRRCSERIDIHARCQYRIALAEMYGCNPVRGRARLLWAAACSPRLTIERLIRVLRKVDLPGIPGKAEPRPIPTVSPNN
jgi:hypothetical protein